MKLNIFSDLRRPGLVPGESLSLAQNYVFCFGETSIYTIYFDLGPDIINKNCKFVFYFNKTDVKPSVLDGGHEIILANWPNDKHIVCTNNNDIPVNVPSFPYVLLNRSVLCNSDIAGESNFVLEWIAVCHNTQLCTLQ